jgi:hypothetical protein
MFVMAVIVQQRVERTEIFNPFFFERNVVYRNRVLFLMAHENRCKTAMILSGFLPIMNENFSR